jgi:hypothetical protein
MDKSALVSFEIENGKEVIDALDNAGQTPQVALWAKLPGYEDWRLVIASDKLDQTSQLTAYEQALSAIRRAGIPSHRKPIIYLEPINAPFIQALRRIFAKTADTFGMRLGNQTFGDQYIEDAFVYRIR